MADLVRSFCRICLNACALKVSVDNGKVVKVSGDQHNPLFKGYTCIKGRSQPHYLYHPERLLYSQKRLPTGEFVRIPVETAMDEIATRLSEIRAQSGPQAIASYAGTMLFTSYTTTMPMLHTFMDVVGSSMRFDTDTLDKGGKLVAAGLHGDWMAPATGFDQPQVALLIGINPVVTFTGLPAGNPGDWLKTKMRHGMKLIVIDPRRSTVAKRADLHLQPMPGFDVDILACFVRIILTEKLYDQAFVSDNVTGLEALRRRTQPFDPSFVANRAGLCTQDLLVAARMLAGHKRGYIMAGTGPHMSSQGTLTEYLVLALQSLCGYWLRAGDHVDAAPTLLAAREYKAQAKQAEEQWAFGEPMGDLGLKRTKAGLPIAALPDEMLASDERRVRAMVTIGGNPIAAIPDTRRTIAALKALELYVQVDPWMTHSASLADYVIAPTMPFEVAATTQALDVLSGWTGYGVGASYAQYTPAVVEPPAGSDVIDDWKFLQGLTKRLHAEGGTTGVDDLTTDRSTDEFIESMTANARVALATVKKHPGGALFPDTAAVVAEKDAGWGERLDVGNEEMMSALHRHARYGPNHADTDTDYPLRLVCRRHLHVYNSSCNFSATNRGKPHNPAYMCASDMQELGLSSGDVVTLRSAHGSVRAIVECDPDLSSGLVSIMFGFGTGAADNDDIAVWGTNPNELLSCSTVYDCYTGQPRMSNVPVEIFKDES